MDDYELITCFKQFIDDNFVQLLVTQTNLYAQQAIDKGNLKAHSRWGKWNPKNLVLAWSLFLLLSAQIGKYRCFFLMCYEDKI